MELFDMALTGAPSENDRGDIEFWMVQRADNATHNRKAMSPMQIAWAERMMQRPLYRTNAELPIMYRGCTYEGKGCIFYTKTGYWKWRPYPKSTR